METGPNKVFRPTVDSDEPRMADSETDKVPETYASFNACTSRLMNIHADVDIDPPDAMAPAAHASP